MNGGRNFLWFDELIALDSLVATQANTWVLAPEKYLRTDGARGVRLTATTWPVPSSGTPNLDIDFEVSDTAEPCDPTAPLDWGRSVTFALTTRQPATNATFLNAMVDGTNSLRNFVRAKVTNKSTSVGIMIRLRVWATIVDC